MTQRTVNLAVIGWGNFFGHIHEQTLRDMAADGMCRLRAVCARSEATRQSVAARNPCDYTTGDHRELLADKQIDAVIIGAPHGVQAAMALDALRTGKYVYVEKPMFADAADTGVDPRAYLDQLDAMGPASLQRLAVGLNKRFAPAYVEAREMAGRCGGVRWLHMSIIDDAWRWGAKYPPGFLMWLDACHWIDLARWFAGSQVARISCLCPQVEDSLVTMQMSGGQVVSVFLSGNGTMDMFKEELRFTTAGRRCAQVTDYIELEVFGGERRDVRCYPANLQSGGDTRHVAAITEGGLAAFFAIRREMFDRFTRLSAAPDAAEEAYLKNNLPNFMRPQGWRESLRAFVQSVAAGRALANSATYRDAYVAYQLVGAARQSVAAGGGFVDAPRG